MTKVREALAELVACKDLKEAGISHDEYLRRMNNAWEAAIAALTTPQVEVVVAEALAALVSKQDLDRCQVDIMLTRGASMLRDASIEAFRCRRAPAVLVSEANPGKDGKVAYMTMCTACLCSFLNDPNQMSKGPYKCVALRRGA